MVSGSSIRNLSNAEKASAPVWTGARFFCRLAVRPLFFFCQSVKRLLTSMRKSILLIAVAFLVTLAGCDSSDPPAMYNLTVEASPSEGGSVSGGGEYEEGTEVDVSAEAAEGWTFVRWEGALSGSAVHQTVTLDSEKSVTAVFEHKEYTLTVNTDGEGSVSEEVVQQAAATQDEYDSGTVVELTAEPAEGWTFVKWQGDLTTSENPATITVDSEKSVTAVFVRREYAFTVNSEGEGSVSEEVISGSEGESSGYLFGSEVQLTAEPAEGWAFVEWQGDLSSNENPAQITVDSEKSVTVAFEREYPLNIVTEGEGNVTEEIVSGGRGEEGYLAGTEVRLEAQPSGENAFLRWEGDLSGSENPTTITVNGEKSVTAIFSQPTEVGGIINSDRTWTEANSPYYVVDKLQIAEGATVTVEAGATIEGRTDAYNGTSIEIFGELVVNGANDSKSYFNDLSIHFIDGGFYGEFNHAVMNGGELGIGEHAGSGEVVVTNSLLRNVTYIKIWGGDARFKRNIFYNSSAIDIVWGDTKPVKIVNNLFYNTGSNLTGGGYYVETYGVNYAYSYELQVQYNTFASTDLYALRLPTQGYNSEMRSAEENYWSTIDESVIEDMIFDKNDDLNAAGEIDYTPYLDSPHPDTPSLPDSLQ